MYYLGIIVFLFINIFNLSWGIVNAGPNFGNGDPLITPRFVSRENTFRVVIGDSIVLPCEVQNLGSFVIVWKRGITLLTAGQQKITTDQRISLLGYNLQVRDIRYSDQGDYTCQIGDGSHGDLIHTVEILKNFHFVRENNRRLGDLTEDSVLKELQLKETIPDDDRINSIILDAWKSAATMSITLGMHVPDISQPCIKVILKEVPLIILDDLQDDDTENCKMPVPDFPEEEETDFSENLSDCEEDVNILKEAYCSQGQLNLKSYDMDDSKTTTKTGFLSIKVGPENKVLRVKKRTLCWLFNQEKEKLSSDRILQVRGVGSTRRKPVRKTGKQTGRKSGKKLVPPSIQILPNSGEVLTTRKGGQVSFECRASGNPTPIVQWSKKEGLLPSGLQVQTGYLLSLNNVQRQDAGIYQCTASNGIGQPVTGEVKLHVLYPPEVSVVKSWVNSGEGLEAKLDCVVHADPPAEVSWYQNSFLLQPTDRRLMLNKGKTFTLTIRNVQFSDFGNYSCSVVNSIGRDKKYIELSGKPGPARVTSLGYSNPHYYDLTWVVQSVLPIIEVKILYRRLLINSTMPFDHKGQWHDLVVKPSQKYDPKTSERIQTYRITNLIPDSVYECLILTKNQHGYSEVSDIHQWFSSQKGRPFIQNSVSSALLQFKSTITFQVFVVLFLL